MFYEGKGGIGGASVFKIVFWVSIFSRQFGYKKYTRLKKT